MANELKHTAVGTELTQAEYEGTASHVFNSQATGDIVYASSSTQLTRLGIGSSGQVLKVSGGLPSWGTDTTNVAASALTGTTMASNVVTSSLTTVGALNSGSITSGFGTINNGSSTITTTGAITGGSLDINGTSQFDGEITVGVDDTGHDVKFFGATAGSYMLWDESGDDLLMTGSSRLAIGGPTTYGVISINIDNEGTNLVRLGGTSKTSGTMAYISRNLPSASTDTAVVRLRQDHTGDDQDTLIVEQDGSGKILNLKDGGSTVFDVADGGAVTTIGTLTVGVDDTGHDVKYFGATSGSYMLWDESADRAVINAGTMMIGGAETVTQRNSGQSKLDINASNTYPRLSITSWSASDYPAYLQLSQSQNDTIGTMTATADGASHGYIRFEGVDSGGNFDLGSSIHSQQDGASGTRVPADLIFTTSTSSSPTEKLRILSTGLVGIGTSAPDHLLSLVNTPATSQIELRGGGTAGGGVFFSNYGNQSGVMSTGVRVNAGSWTADTTSSGGSGSASIYLQAGSTHYWYSNGSTTDGNNISPAQVFTIVAGGNATLAGTLTESSDARLKTNINTIDSALDKVTQMRGVTYDRTDYERSGTGIIAQELEQIAPELVEDNDEYKSVAYTKLTAYLIEAIKELNHEIKELKGN